MLILVTAALYAIVPADSLSLLIGEQFQAVDVNGLTSAKSFLGTDSQLYASTFTSQYCLSVWIKCTALPPADTKPVSIVTNNKVNLRLVTRAAGGLSGYSDLYQGLSATVNAGSGLTAGEWLLVAVCACEDQLSIATVKYQGVVSMTSLTIAGVFMEFDPRNSQIKAYGDTALTTKMLALTLTLDTCLTSDILATQASQCSLSCSACIGPDVSGCKEYAQLVSPFEATVATHATPIVFQSSDSRLEGRDYSSLSVAVTGWFKNSATVDVNLFRVRNKNCEVSVLPTSGCTVIAQYVYGTIVKTWVDTEKTANVQVNDLAPLPASFTTDVWYFFSGSNCASTSENTHCFSSISSIPTCIKTPLLSPTFPFLKAVASAEITIGDSDAGPITGEMLDVRLYIGHCIDPTEAQRLVTEKQTTCQIGCLSCSEPKICLTCITGYFFDTVQCKRCNSCCQDCSGALSTECITCASACTQVAPNTCLCNSLFSLLFRMRKLLRDTSVAVFELQVGAVYAAFEISTLFESLSEWVFE